MTALFVAVFVVFAIVVIQAVCRWSRSVQARQDRSAHMLTRVKR